MMRPPIPRNLILYYPCPTFPFTAPRDLADGAAGTHLHSVFLFHALLTLLSSICFWVTGKFPFVISTILFPNLNQLPSLHLLIQLVSLLAPTISKQEHVSLLTPSLTATGGPALPVLSMALSRPDCASSGALPHRLPSLQRTVTDNSPWEA